MYQGNTLSLKTLDDAVVEMSFDLQGESVNKFNRQTVRELSEALDILEQRHDLAGLVITSAKPAFMVGADVNEFESVFAAGPEKVREYLALNNRNYNRLEDLPVPVVIAVAGYALGGGLELCLACDYRIASRDAKLGFPETKLGIIPGWGGTVRMPRLVGLDSAAEWIASARNYDSQSALKAGIVDSVVETDQLQSAALDCLRQCREDKLNFKARRTRKTGPLNLNEIEAGLAFESTKGFVAAQAGPYYPAPLRAIEVMQNARKEGRDRALEIEADAFAELAASDTARALVGIFLNDQLLTRKAKGWERQADKPVQRAAVLGAGIMGGGIAYQSAVKGIPVKMKDIAQAGIDQGLNEANKLLTKQVQRGRLDIGAMGEALNRIEPTLNYDGFDRVDLVVEAVVERAEVKRAALQETENKVTLDTVLASNTSTISISSLAESLQRPENFCGMHFFNPVYAMPLVEVIRAEKTSDRAIARTVAYANALGKKPVVVKDCPGFLVNRVLFPYFAGFAQLVRDGVDFHHIDKVMENWGWPMGPAYLLDVVGLDTAIHAEKVMAEAFPDRLARDYISCTEALHQVERLGQKTAKGFYDYEIDRKGKPVKKASAEADELVAEHMAEALQLDDQAIIARMVLPMAAELARCLEEGIVETPAEADMALVYGLGFPAFRGGLLRWIDSMGIKQFADMAADWARLGPLYELPESLNKRLAEGRPFYKRQDL